MDSATTTSPAAMAELASEFRHILISLAFPVKTESTSLGSMYTDSEFSSYSQDGVRVNLTLTPVEAIDDLRRIAGLMMASGDSWECVEAYATARRTVLEERLDKLGIEKMSAKSIQRLEWPAQEAKIHRWIHAARIAVRVLFADEKRLCRQIFEDLGNNVDVDDDACFVETIRDSTIRLLNFAGAISSGRKSPEKLFRILDLHQVLSDLLPDIEANFGSESGGFIRNKAVDLLSCLSDAVRGTLSEFEKAVSGEPTKVPISGGTVHPLTRYVMNYIRTMAEDYKQDLEGLILSKPSTHDLDFTELECHAASSLELHFLWIVANLKSNLEGKSKQYNDTSLSHLFMMNNIHYIVGKINGSSTLSEIFGYDYLNKLTEEYHLAASSYQKTTWGRAMDCLTYDNNGILSSVFRRGPRQKLKAFSGKFAKVLATQAAWVVPDSQLRDELRFSIAKVLIPVYTSFLEMHRRGIESGKHPENYIKYSVEDVKKAVMNLFESC